MGTLSEIGYIDESPFLKVNKSVKYPTWFMSSLCGAINASVLITFEEDDDIHGPVKLHYMNKVCSVGRGDGLQMQIKGDDSIEEEHGMISYRNDELLYVNSSGALTTIDGVGISSEQGPVVFKNGTSLTIGATTIVVSSYMEFAVE